LRLINTEAVEKSLSMWFLNATDGKDSRTASEKQEKEIQEIKE
jgi:hypothetical protein